MLLELPICTATWWAKVSAIRCSIRLRNLEKVHRRYTSGNKLIVVLPPSSIRQYIASNEPVDKVPISTGLRPCMYVCILCAQTLYVSMHPLCNLCMYPLCYHKVPISTRPRPSSSISICKSCMVCICTSAHVSTRVYERASKYAC